MAGQPFESRTSVITCDTQGIVQEYAADAADLFGWTQDEVIGKMSVAMFHVPKNVPTLVPRLLREAVEKGKFEEEVVLMRKDGSTFRAVLTVRPILRDGQHVGYMGMTRPLTPPGPVPGRAEFANAPRGGRSLPPPRIPHRPVPRIRGRPPSPVARSPRRRGRLFLRGAAAATGPPRGRRDRRRNCLRAGDGPRSVLRPHTRDRSARGHPLPLPRSARLRHPLDQRDPRHPGGCGGGETDARGACRRWPRDDRFRCDRPRGLSGSRPRRRSLLLYPSGPPRPPSDSPRHQADPWTTAGPGPSARLAFVQRVDDPRDRRGRKSTAGPHGPPNA